MKLKKASYKAIKYACMNFHYAKSIPINPFGFSVFNSLNQWCGVVLFSHGANRNIGSEYNLNQGQAIELVRVALNGKQESTSKCLSLSLKLIVKYVPTAKLIISYADKGQNHNGIIYQATNWIYTGENESSGYEVLLNGKWVHKRTFDSTGKKQSDYKKRSKPGKYKYIYPLDKELIPMCKALAKPYPKKEQHAALAHKGEQPDTNREGAFDSTVPL